MCETTQRWSRDGSPWSCLRSGDHLSSSGWVPLDLQMNLTPGLLDSEVKSPLPSLHRHRTWNLFLKFVHTTGTNFTRREHTVGRGRHGIGYRRGRLSWGHESGGFCVVSTFWGCHRTSNSWRVHTIESEDQVTYRLARSGLSLHPMVGCRTLSSIQPTISMV